MRMQVLVLLSCLIGLSFSANGQDSLNRWKRWGKKMKENAVQGSKDNDSYSITSLGLSAAQVQDTKMAPNLYSGLGGVAGMGWFNMHRKHQTKATLEFSYTMPSFNEAIGADYNNVRAMFSFNHRRFLNPDNPKWLVGADLHVTDGFRFYGYLGNSAVHNDLIIGLRPQIGYQNKRRILRRDAFWYSNFGVDALAFVNRAPEYNLSGSNSYLRPVGGFNHFRFDIGFSRAMRFSENRFGMEYTWDFYAYNELEGLHKTRSAQHFITLNWWFKSR